MKIPFTNYEVIKRDSIQFLDHKTSLPISFEVWSSRFNRQKRTPILENIFDTIATEFSKIDLLLVRDIYIVDENAEEGAAPVHIYEKLENNPNYNVLALRPNMLQTKSELLYTIAYQLHMYRNALVRIVRDTSTDRNIVLALEPLNLDDYLLGQGYEIGNNLYLKLKEKKTGQVLLLDYGDLIHLRLNPNDMFYGDKNENNDLTHFVKLFDENLNVLLNELKNSGRVDGIIEIGGYMAGGGFNNALGTKESKLTKQEEITERIKTSKDGLLVLDSGEKWHPMTRTFRTMSSEEINNIMKYLYNFKGINQAVIDGTATEAQMEVFFNKTIMPIIERFLEELNYKFLTQTARTQGQKIEYFKNPFEYMSTKDALSILYLGGMYLTQNEGRRMALKLPPQPGGDVLMDNKNFTKNGASYSTEGGEPSEQDVEQQVEQTVGKQLNGAQTQSLITIIGQYAAGAITLGQAINIVSIAIGISKEEAKKIIEGLE